MKTKVEEKVEEMIDVQPQTREFSKAELAHLREKANAANAAVAEYNKFLAFLREQHEIAEGDESWQLTDRGFAQRAVPVPAPALNGHVKEGV